MRQKRIALCNTSKDNHLPYITHNITNCDPLPPPERYIICRWPHTTWWKNFGGKITVTCAAILTYQDFISAKQKHSSMSQMLHCTMHRYQTFIFFCLTSLFSGDNAKLRPGPPKGSKGEPLRIAEAEFFTGQMLFRSPNQQCQSTEAINGIALRQRNRDR